MYARSKHVFPTAPSPTVTNLSDRSPRASPEPFIFSMSDCPSDSMILIGPPETGSAAAEVVLAVADDVGDMLTDVTVVVVISGFG